ncbi:type VII secretion target [Nocardia sp. NPDC003345]
MNEGETGTTTAVRVDPGTLRAFAGKLETEAGAITALDSTDALSAAAGALPGTGFGVPAQRAADLTDACLRRASDRLTTVAALLRTDAGTYEMSESDFAAALATVGLDIRA